MEDAIETVGHYRDAVGVDVDLCIEIHRRLTPSEAIVLARGIEPFHPFFYEDPILPDSFDAMALVAQHIHIPIRLSLDSVREIALAQQIGFYPECREDDVEARPHSPISSHPVRVRSAAVRIEPVERSRFGSMASGQPIDRYGDSTARPGLGSDCPPKRSGHASHSEVPGGERLPESAQ